MLDRQYGLFARTLILFSIVTAPDAWAYVGPGAGFAVISSFFVLFLTVIIAFFTTLLWPFRAFILFLKRRKIRKKRKVKRVVVLGLDGFDPVLTKKFLKRGLLPNFRKLKNNGSFRLLKTTNPAISPVAWSTFSTGVNPGKHRIFDFYTRDPKTYLPVLSSAHISSSHRVLKIGPFKIPLVRANVHLLRKSTSMWKILGENGIFSTVLRVPITFPPENFYGTCLSAMCTPDLRGTQGSFTYFTTQNDNSLDDGCEGYITNLNLDGNIFKSNITGPSIQLNGSSQSLLLPIEGKIDVSSGSVSLKVGKKHINLTLGEYSPWVKLQFKAGLRKRISGLTRFLLIEIEPHLKIYMTPINIDPEKPALPISHPFFYSISLAKLQGPFSTLGLAEDTWALNERVIDEGAFLKQSYDIFEERKQIFMDSLRKIKDGLVVNVFDTTDRIQHMFFRYMDENHPANRDKDVDRYRDTIEKLYIKMDELLGEVFDLINKNDVLMIISDHGFKTFKWGVNLNSWLWKEGYLVLKNGDDLSATWFKNVDWSKTRAYAYGLAGIFLNLHGRERFGQVKSGNDQLALQLEIKGKLEAFQDSENGKRPVRRVFLAQAAFNGPYVNDAPDLLVGLHPGYRVSWNSAIGKVTNDTIEENTRSWSGDHTIDPDLIPGVFFSNWKLEDKTPALADLAPTILSLLGVGKQTFHDGKELNLYPPNI